VLWTLDLSFFGTGDAGGMPVASKLRFRPSDEGVIGVSRSVEEEAPLSVVIDRSVAAFKFGALLGD
jgi:hypothetical protein